MRTHHFLPLLLSLFALALGCADDEADPAACPSGTRCDGACVDTDSDASHCGGCGLRCETGEVCAAGSCAAACPQGMEACEGGCFDLDSSDSHCGACGTACDAGRICAGGACVCPEGATLCDGSCVDTDADAAHCGGCGNACDEGMACEGGSCVPDCGEGMLLCGDTCVDASSDDVNCGACGITCGGGSTCVEGLCLCPEGGVRCGDRCVDLAVDMDHCGACGATCTAGAGAASATCSEGACVQACEEGLADCDGDAANGCEVALDTDADHCGACGNVCGDDERCEAGVCCGPEGLVCGGACVDPGSDPAHCGACDVSCEGLPGSTGGICEAKVCVLGCEASSGDCNEDPADGCETDLGSDRFHCGACGNQCGALCGGGECLSVVLAGGSFGHVCALLGDGSVYCWGNNADGQLADGSIVHRSAPVQVPIAGAVDIVAGPFHTCARNAEGGVQCWGRNDAGQLGGGDTTPVTAPVTVLDGGVPLLGAIDLALTDASTCALLDDGKVKCWGSGAGGRLGDGTTSSRLAPAYVTVAGVPLEDVAGIAAGMEHVCARLIDGTVRCWGAGSNGRLGVGDENDRLEPTPVPGLVGVDEIAAAGRRSCARSGGSVHCWGEGALGQVGDGAGAGTRLLPSPVDGLTDAISLHLAYNHGFARRADGTTVGWGMPYGNLLNDGLPIDATFSFRFSPTTLLEPGLGGPWIGLKDVLAGSASFTCVVEANDAISCWGLDGYGQLGDGGPVNSADARPEPDAVAW